MGHGYLVLAFRWLAMCRNYAFDGIGTIVFRLYAPRKLQNGRIPSALFIFTLPFYTQTEMVEMLQTSPALPPHFLQT
jgi:hypothetical protein